MITFKGNGISSTGALAAFGHKSTCARNALYKKLCLKFSLKNILF